MDSGVAFGAGKAGQPFDPISFLIRPQVILRFLCWIFSVVVFACIYRKGTYPGPPEFCLYNSDANACTLGTLVGGIGLLGALAFIALEALFQQISSVKVRRRVVAADIGFSAAWGFLYFVCFAYLVIAWNQGNYPPLAYGINNCRAAIIFSLLSIATWAGCAYFAWLRWKSGTDMSAFASGFDEMGGDGGGGYAAYAAGNEEDAAYQEGMYTGAIDQHQGNYVAPTY